MARSMTGYGKGTASDGPASLTVEVRSVNGRQREVRIKLPRELAPLESKLREQVNAVVLRGRVDVLVRWERGSASTPDFALNIEAAERMFAAWNRLAERLEIDSKPKIESLLSLPGVIESIELPEIDLDAALSLITAALGAALDSHREERTREGEALRQDLEQRTIDIRRSVEEIKKLTGDGGEKQAATLHERVKRLLGEVPLDESRVALEIALLAQRSDATEELVRLDAHLVRLARLLDPGCAELGKEIEFIVQEIRREVNTLGAKCAEPQIDERVLSIKSELEKIREQAANLE